MDMVDYHIFINPLVNHIENRFLYHRQFNFCSSQNYSYFALAILFKMFSPHNFYPIM